MANSGINMRPYVKPVDAQTCYNAKAMGAGIVGFGYGVVVGAGAGTYFPPYGFPVGAAVGGVLGIKGGLDILRSSCEDAFPGTYVGTNGRVQGK